MDILCSPNYRTIIIYDYLEVKIVELSPFTFCTSIIFSNLSFISSTDDFFILNFWGYFDYCCH
jgi:hypothetical protein